MKIIVAICVYNRFLNIKRWVECWKQSKTESAELVIIHNHYGDEALHNKFKKLCTENEVKYVPRDAKGFDIGAFQDVCRERLEGFPDFDYLLWCTDDVFPMTKDFIALFIEKLEDKNVGVSCMQISASVEPHVRTSGFCIKKEIATKINFPVDPVTTKQDCYTFEHRGGARTFTNQIRSMGLAAVMVAPINISPLWDSLHPNLKMRLDRQKEFNEMWGIAPGDKVVFICPIFEMYPQIISSLICQTHKNWELILIYNGPCNNNLPEIIKNIEDKRIQFIIYPEATGKWGHVLRQWALKEMSQGKLSDAQYVVIQNADNYLAPPFIEYLLKGFENSHTAVATYCSDTVHSYKNWNILPAKLERGYIDCGAVMVKKDIACEIGWNSLEHSSDWTYFHDIASKYSWKNFIKINGCLFVHN